MPLALTPREILLRAFPGIPPAEAEELASVGEVRSYPPNTILCYENAIASTFYIILEGKVKVTKVIDRDQTRLLKGLKAGDFFGEMALIHDAPRAATVTTTMPTTVLEIHKDSFDRLMRRSASLSLAMVREVSRRLRENDAMAIEELRMKTAELAASYQRLAEQEYARQEFLSTIAHELRTPLTAANGYLQMMQSGKLEGEALHEALDSVRRNVQHVVSLVNDILFMQEMDLINLRFQPVDLSEVARQALDDLRSLAEEKQIRFQAEIPDGLPPVAGEPKSLERAFRAILDNAVKFSPAGSQVRVGVRQEGSRLVVEVKDQGAGIPPEYLPHIFDRFFHVEQQGEEMYNGLGLGLSLTRQVIEHHKGEISVNSEVGKGSTVSVYLDTLDEDSL
jgi:signal transduction histidine kinase